MHPEQGDSHQRHGDPAVDGIADGPVLKQLRAGEGSVELTSRLGHVVSLPNGLGFISHRLGSTVRPSHHPVVNDTARWTVHEADDAAVSHNSTRSPPCSLALALALASPARSPLL